MDGKVLAQKLGRSEGLVRWILCLPPPRLFPEFSPNQASGELVCGSSPLTA